MAPAFRKEAARRALPSSSFLTQWHSCFRNPHRYTCNAAYDFRFSRIRELPYLHR